MFLYTGKKASNFACIIASEASCMEHPWMISHKGLVAGRFCSSEQEEKPLTEGLSLKRHDPKARTLEINRRFFKAASRFLVIDSNESVSMGPI